MVTTRQLKLVSLGLFVLSMVMLISALGVPKFLVGELHFSSQQGSSGSLDMTVNVGAIHVCVEYSAKSGGQSFSASGCSVISSKCTATFSDTSGREVTTAEEWVDNCKDFNAFRGLLITGTILCAFALIAGVVNLCMPAAPKWTHALVIFPSLLAGLFIIISLLAFTNAAYEGSIALEGTNAKAGKGASVYLEGVGVALCLLAVGVWLAAFRQSVSEATTAYGSVGAPGAGQPILAPAGGQYDPRYQQQQYFAGQPQYAEQYVNAPQQPMQYSTPDAQLRQPLTTQ